MFMRKEKSKSSRETRQMTTNNTVRDDGYVGFGAGVGMGGEGADEDRKLWSCLFFNF